jgi:hypothetical protein
MISHLEIRYRISRLLNLPLSDSEWAFLESQRLLNDLHCGRITIESLAIKIRQLREAFGGAPPVLNREKSGLPPDERCHALAAVIGQEIIQATMRFREKHLSGRFLAESELKPWIEKQAERDGPPSWLGEFEVPSLDSLDVPRPTGDFRSLRPVTLDPPFLGPTIHVRLGGVLDSLRNLAAVQAEEYGISPSEACRTILTGLPPRIKAISIRPYFKRIPAASRFVITVDPAVTPMELARAYRDARRQYLKARVRKLSRKHLQLAVFMSARPVGERGADAMREWNRKFKRWRYTHVSNFLRDATMARRRLLFPGGLDYSPGGFE